MDDEKVAVRGDEQIAFRNIKGTQHWGGQMHALLDTLDKLDAGLGDVPLIKVSMGVVLRCKLVHRW